MFGSVRLELEPNSTLVRFVFGKFELLKAKPSTLYSLASELWIAGVIPGLGSQNNGRGTMAEEQWPRNNGRKNNDVTGVHKYSEIGIIKNSVVFA